MTRQPFEADFKTLKRDLDHYVEMVFSSLESDFLSMPKGAGFIEYPLFEAGYETLKNITEGFGKIDPESVVQAAVKRPLILIILRVMLGFTPPEWAYLASSSSQIAVSQTQIRALDRGIRLKPSAPLKLAPASLKRVRALVETACRFIVQGAPDVESDRLHRLDKADTKHGVSSLQNMAGLGIPYAMLLYERFLGRPFAGHRDSVSELIGDGLEGAIEELLTKAKMSFRKTKRAERLPGFDQAPDFILPDEFAPKLVIEAKITEDDGTARDKITRIQHLAELGRSLGTRGRGFAVIACIGGRGFGVRREDMRKLLLSTEGMVFTPKTLNSLPSRIIRKILNPS